MAHAYDLGYVEILWAMWSYEPSAYLRTVIKEWLRLKHWHRLILDTAKK